jgi:D-alanyl-D-alanine carboxypeptidase
MTTYLVFRAMREGKLQPETLITVSENAVAQPPSKMGFKAGTQLTVDNALKMLMVKSANDIAVVLAEGAGGNLPQFVEQMNLTATKLGMTGTHFANPNGLPDDSQVTTARDMAVLARAIIREFPEYELYFRIPAIQMGKRLLRNHNKLIDHYIGADGMKTGFICSSGFNVVATAKRGEKRLIAVVFGSYSASQRTEDAARLFEKGFGHLAAIKAMFGGGPHMLEAIENQAVAPVDLREQMCNARRKRPVAESDIDDDDEEETAPEPAGKNGAKKSKGKHTLLMDLPPSMPPIRVFVGAAPGTPQTKIAMAAAKAAKSARTAAVSGGAPSPAASSALTGDAHAAAADTVARPNPAPAAAIARAVKLPKLVPLPRPRPKI